jgi:hypothetical protein
MIQYVYLAEGPSFNPTNMELIVYGKKEWPSRSEMLVPGSFRTGMVTRFQIINSGDKRGAQ